MQQSPKIYCKLLKRKQDLNYFNFVKISKGVHSKKNYVIASLSKIKEV